MATCPAGHESESTDFCDTCGMRIRESVPAPAPWPLAAPPSGHFRPPASPPAQPDLLAEPCPGCGTARPGQFCEACGLDLRPGRAAVTADSSGPASAHPADARHPPLPVELARAEHDGTQPARAQLVGLQPARAPPRRAPPARARTGPVGLQPARATPARPGTRPVRLHPARASPARARTGPVRLQPSRAAGARAAGARATPARPGTRPVRLQPARASPARRRPG